MKKEIRQTDSDWVHIAYIPAENVEYEGQRCVECGNFDSTYHIFENKKTHVRVLVCNACSVSNLKYPHEEEKILVKVEHFQPSDESNS